MGEFNEIQVGRFNLLLHKLLDMKEGAPAPQLAAEVMPTLQLAGERPDWLFLGQERLCSGGVQIAAVAAQNGFISLFNPAGSNTIATVNGFAALGANVLGTIRALSAQTAGAVTPPTGSRDSRWNINWGTVNADTQLTMNGGTIAVLPGVVLTNHNFRLEHGFVPWPMVLEPGTGVQFAAGVVNTNFGVSVSWIERHLERSESR